MKIKIAQWTAGIVFAVFTACPGIAASFPPAPDVTAQMVVTAVKGPGQSQPGTLEPGELTVLEGKTPAPVVNLERLSRDLADTQLFVFLDDSTRSSSLGVQIPELKAFLTSLPAATEVAIGYMRNGTFALDQAFTTDHAKAAKAVRLPNALPGENGSPYFALEDLVKHWPSSATAKRRAVLMLTDGVDRYFTPAIMEDPYVEAATENALKHDVMVYSIYLRGAGLYGRGLWLTTIAQSRLLQVSENTGGYAYFQDMTDPVTISPFLTDLQQRLQNQYRVTITPKGSGLQQVKYRTEAPGVKVEGPAQIYVR